MKCSFVKIIFLAAASTFSLQVEIAAADGIYGLNGFLSPKFYSASELRTSDRQSSVAGDVGVHPGSDHRLYFRGQRVTIDNGTSIEKYGLTYRWKLHDQTTLLLKTTKIEHNSGKSRTDYGVGLRQGIPTKLVVSSIHLGYRSAENIHTQIEARYSAAKKLRHFPLRLTGDVKWRQREPLSGNVVGDIGGSFGLHYNVKPHFSLTLNHNLKDDISPEKLTLTGTIARLYGRNNVTFKMGATNEKTAFFRVQSLLGI